MQTDKSSYLSEEIINMCTHTLSGVKNTQHDSFVSVEQDYGETETSQRGDGIVYTI